MADLFERHKEELFEGFSIFSIILILLVVFATSMTTQSNFVFVFIGFLPSILTIILSLIIYEESKFTYTIMWIMPLLLAGAFFILASQQTTLAVHLDVLWLVVVNIVISLLYLAICFLLFKVLSKKYYGYPKRVV